MTALITGATGGLGRELAMLFARDDHNLLLTARNADELAVLQQQLEREFHVHVRSVVLDLSDPQAASKLHRYAHEHGIIVDYLVNNAGFADWNSYMRADTEKLRSMMQVNMCALAELTRLFGADMVQRHNGHILNISSIASTIPGPYMAMYYASKAFVRSLSEAIAYELRGTGVSVTCVCPGPTSIGFEKAANMHGKNFFTMTKPATPRAVAGFAYRKMNARAVLAYAGAFSKSAAFAARFVPDRLAAACAAVMNGGDLVKQRK